MKFQEAFRKLGYELVAVRTDWSAASDAGVCISLWSKETDWDNLVMDTRVHASPIDKWGHKPGNKRRIQHASLAIEKFGGWVDVVKIEGIPDQSYGAAFPWDYRQRGKRWRITFLDRETGHIRLEAQ